MMLTKFTHACVRLEKDGKVLVFDPGNFSEADRALAGADAFFDEKYGEQVRTIRVEGYSHELCGGTHCRATGQVGSFVIIGERSIGSGMRRAGGTPRGSLGMRCRWRTRR